MPDYQDFVRKAKERFQERQKNKAQGNGEYQFTLHAQFKMKQYSLSEQKVRNVIRNPKRKEEGIVPKTVAVMQPVSMKKIDGKDVWKQEVWVMYTKGNSKLEIRNLKEKTNFQFPNKIKNPKSANRAVRIISVWRYPGVSPKRNPIPDEILRELEEGCIIEPTD